MAFSQSALLAVTAVSLWLVIDSAQQLIDIITNAKPNECSFNSVHGVGKCVELGLAAISVANETGLGKNPVVQRVSTAGTVYVDIPAKIETAKHIALKKRDENIYEAAKIIQPWFDQAANWYGKRQAEKVFEAVHKEEAARIVVEWMSIERTDAEWLAEFTKVVDVAKKHDEEITLQNAEAERQRTEAEKQRAKAEKKRAEAEAEKQRAEAEAEKQRAEAEAERQRAEAEAERQRQQEIRKQIESLGLKIPTIPTIPTIPRPGRGFPDVTINPIPHPTNLQPFNLPPL
jgi:hypothetical protein